MGANFQSAALAIICIIVLVFVYALLLSLPVMWLWNWLMPLIFGLTKLTWMQSFGVLLLSGFLFKSSNSNSK